MKNNANGNGSGGKGQKRKWSLEEEEALRRGVERYGTGKWKPIQNDPEFKDILASRSNVDLKDKWRNIVNNRPKHGGDFQLDVVPKRRKVKQFKDDEEELELEEDEEEDAWNSPGPSTRKLRSHRSSRMMMLEAKMEDPIDPRAAEVTMKAARIAAEKIALAEYAAFQAEKAAREAYDAEDLAETLGRKVQALERTAGAACV